MRIMIVAGGTGGHVYPALATAEALVKLYPEQAILSFVGNVGGFERPLLERATIQFDSYDEVQSGPLHGVNPVRAVTSLFKLTAGFFQAIRILGKRKPQAILLTGGWAGFPIAAAARLRGIPMLIYLPDIEPGLTINILKRFAQKVAVTLEESLRFFKPGQGVVTGYPLRDEMYQATAEQGREYFKLNPHKKTVLVFGGSRGARAINSAFGEILPRLLENERVQVIHVTGTLDWERSQEQTASVRDDPDYHAFDYLHGEMALAFAASDLVVCRAGASILGEFPFFQLPAILIPLAYSWRYQQVNAAYLETRGAAIHLEEAEMSARLLPLLDELLMNEAKLDTLKAGMAALAQPEGAANVARELAKLVKGA